MHIVFVHFHFQKKCNQNLIYENHSDKRFQYSVVQRKEQSSQEGKYYFINDEFNSELKWWQNPDKLYLRIQKLQPDVVYLFDLNLPLQYRWLKHFIPPKTKLIGQHCGESPWIQKNLWLQQSALRFVDAFVFNSTKDAQPWLKCAAILETQPIFNVEDITNNTYEIMKEMLNKDFES